MIPYQVEVSENVEARRERLILEQLPQVHFIARRLHERLPESVAWTTWCRPASSA